MTNKNYIPAELSSLSYREADKIGNLLHIISKKSKGVYLTRLLKLIYLIDEKSVQEIGVPVTQFEYKVAKKGPLVEELWTALNNGNCFQEYIKTTKEKNEEGQDCIRIDYVGEVNEKRFSAYELELIENTIKEYKSYSTPDLIELLHQDGTLWNKIVKENNISFYPNKISEHSIDLKEYVKGNETLTHFYDSYKK